MLLSIADIENVTIGELSQCLGMDQTTTTRAIKVLYKMGLVAFATTPEDGRKKVVVLTASGVQKIKEVDPLWEEAQFKIENSFKEANLTAMLKLLNQLIAITK